MDFFPFSFHFLNGEVDCIYPSPSPGQTSALLHITYSTVRKNNYLIVGTLLSVLCV